MTLSVRLSPSGSVNGPRLLSCKVSRAPSRMVCDGGSLSAALGASLTAARSTVTSRLALLLLAWPSSTVMVTRRDVVSGALVS